MAPTYTWTVTVSGPDPWVIPVGDDPNALAWKKTVEGLGSVVSAARLTLVGTLIQGLKADSLWTKLDRLWLFAAENGASAIVDIVALGQMIPTGPSVTFTANRGYTGEDLASPLNYLNMGINLNALANYSLNSGHISAWQSTTTVMANGGACFGVVDGGTNRSALFTSNAGVDAVFAALNEGTTPNLGISSRKGHWIVNRPSSTSRIVYQNGNVFNTSVVNSVALPNASLAALAINNNGSIESGNANTYAMLSVGAGLTALESGKLYSRLRDYMNAVGAP